ncbi:MAG: NAD(P)H-hydrate dehydratase [Planctomycetota bacterium]|nr:NAD(P)H-hydrate dehydratase [Planctomycetota bacterium]
MTDARRIEDVPALARRSREGHKGDYGRVLIVGGSGGMIGAPALAANAALRGGAGLVQMALPETVQLTVASLAPCATSLPLACKSDGALAHRSVAQFIEAAGAADVLAVGPGMGVGPAQQDLVRAALGAGKGLVLDADGLNNLSRIADWPALCTGPLVLTPHPGEFATLTGRAVRDIQADREGLAAWWARTWSAGSAGPIVCVLKGAGTVVTDGQRLFVNQTGNPGMATGGAGDVLTGLTAALWCQLSDPFEAACLAAHCHGRAGDLAADALGEVSLTAVDLIAHLPAAIRERTELPSPAQPRGSRRP